MQIVLDYAFVASQTHIRIDKDTKINKKLSKKNILLK